MNYRYDITPISIGGEKSVHHGICIETRLEVVLKFVKRPYTRADVDRLHHEIQRMQSAKRTAGDSISTIIDYNLESDPPFYVEEYYPDGTLAKWMGEIFSKKNVFKPEWALGLTHQMLVALRGIHASNQIHRDVKPANILYRSQGHRLVFSDMGIGRTLTRPTLLQTRMMKGTRGYCAPEQEVGGGVDHRADLYSVGVILHEMLTGVRGSWNDITYNTNRNMRIFIENFLQFPRERRYQNAQAALNDIERIGFLVNPK